VSCVSWADRLRGQRFTVRRTLEVGSSPKSPFWDSLNADHRVSTYVNSYTPNLVPNSKF